MSDKRLRALEKAAEKDPSMLPALRLEYVRSGKWTAKPWDWRLYEEDPFSFGKDQHPVTIRFKTAEDLGFSYFVGIMRFEAGIEFYFFTTNRLGTKRWNTFRERVDRGDASREDESRILENLHQDSPGVWVGTDKENALVLWFPNSERKTNPLPKRKNFQKYSSGRDFIVKAIVPLLDDPEASLDFLTRVSSSILDGYSEAEVGSLDVLQAEMLPASQDGFVVFWIFLNNRPAAERLRKVLRKRLSRFQINVFMESHS